MRTTTPQPAERFDQATATFAEFLQYLEEITDIDYAVTFLPKTWIDWSGSIEDESIDPCVFAELTVLEQRRFVRWLENSLTEFPRIKARRAKFIAGLKRIPVFSGYPFGPGFIVKRGLIGLSLLAIVGLFSPWPMREPPTSDLAMDVFIFPSPTEGIAAGAEGRIQGSIRPSMFPEVRNPKVAVYSHRDDWRLERIPTLRTTSTKDRLSWSGTVRAATDYAVIVFDPSVFPEASLPGSFAEISKRPPSLRYGRWLLPLGNWDGSQGTESDIEWKAHAKKKNDIEAKMDAMRASIAKDRIAVGGWRWPWWRPVSEEGNRALRVEYDIREEQSGWVSARMRNAPVLSRSALVGFSANFAAVSATEFGFDIKTPLLGELEDDHSKNRLGVRGPDQWQRFRISLSSLVQKDEFYRNKDFPESGEVVLSLNDRDFVGKKGGAGSFHVDDAFILDVLP